MNTRDFVLTLTLAVIANVIAIIIVNKFSKK